MRDHHRSRSEPEPAQVRCQALAGARLRRPVYKVFFSNPGASYSLSVLIVYRPGPLVELYLTESPFATYGLLTEPSISHRIVE